jgi:hypothetical protein
MKSILLSAAVLLLVSISFANNPPEVNEKVLEAFKKTFNTQEEVTWYENESSFEARFSSDGIKTIVWYNKKGSLILTHRNYDGCKLPPMILSKLSSELPDQKVLGVTEITNKTGMLYYITLEGEKTWMKIKADVQGDFEVYEKFKKA